MNIGKKQLILFEMMQYFLTLTKEIKEFLDIKSK
jgi:hypothetical protein